jgi:hypothetical protein
VRARPHRPGRDNERFDAPPGSNASAARCARALTAALETSGKALAAAQGSTDPEQWRSPVRTLAFTPLPLVPLQYTNRPSGSHQAFRFG